MGVCELAGHAGIRRGENHTRTGGPGGSGQQLRQQVDQSDHAAAVDDLANSGRHAAGQHHVAGIGI